MFPDHSGVFIAKRNGNLLIVTVKGVYPTLKLGDRAIDLGEYLKNGKLVEVNKHTLEAVELFHMSWEFLPLNVNISVFSNTEFDPTGTNLYLSDEDIMYVQGLYYRLCQQGVSPLKAVRAISYEYKISKEQVLNLINKFDAQATIR